MLVRAVAAGPRLARAVAVLSIAGASLGVVVLGSSRAATAATAAAVADRAVLVLVPGLDWSIAPAELGTLARANLSVRAAPARSRAADGYLTVSKGARAGGLRPNASVGRVGVEGRGLRLLDWDRLRGHDDSFHVAGHIGALGQSLRSAHVPWGLVYRNPGAAAAAVDRFGHVPLAVRGAAPAVAEVLAAGTRALIVQTTRTELADVLAAAGQACVVVATPNTANASRHLGVLAITGPCGLGAGGLTAGSTHQPHLTTLADVAPTFLGVLGIKAPEGMDGRPLRRSAPVSVARLIREDRKAFATDRARSPFVLVFVGVHAAAATLAIARPRLRVPVALTLLSVPTAAFVMMVVPWWHWRLAGAVLTCGALTAVIAAAAAQLGRANPGVAVASLAGLAAVVIAVDGALGGALELDAPFGNSPVAAGRFYGVGNIGLGVAVAGLLVGAGVVVERSGRRALPWVGIALVTSVVLIGAPAFGAKVGASLTCVPAFVAFLLVHRRARLSWRLVGVLMLGAVVAAGAFAALDLALPARSQTHFARALHQHRLGDLVLHKAGEAAASVKQPFGLVLVVAGVVLAVVRPQVARRPALRAAAAGLVVAALAGSALNDSGIVVGAAVAAVAWPAAIVIAARP